jgi:glycosyltransferase involved in cell wall biosynthesis
MDNSSQVFSHQIGVVNELSKYFDKVTVITGKAGEFELSKNVEVFSSHWKPGKRVYSSVSFVILFLRLMNQIRFNLVFSHMTSVQSAIISPITRIFRIKHFLWYTHTSDNLALRIAHRLTDGILTATEGSCPIKSSKVKVVGHSIDASLFQTNYKIRYPIINFIHIGRFDSSKNIDLILEVLCNLKKYNQEVTFTNIGSPSGKDYLDYQKQIVEKYSSGVENSWINFKQAMSRNLLADFMQRYDAFIHAFKGSLDKSVLEATFLGLPVVTLNPEYLKIFGSWNLNNRSDLNTLDTELDYLMKLSLSELKSEIDRRIEIAQNFYELKGWAQRVSSIMKS